jgi:DNA protecting protein DprA
VLSERELPLLNRLADKDLSRAKQIDDYCLTHNIGLLSPDNDAYPRALYQLRDAPVLLYYVGNLPNFEDKCALTVVGTRKMTEYGRNVACQIGHGLACGGAILVSGMALGNDGMAMAGAIDADGVTVGILGCGVDIVYPQEHRELMKKVLEKGCILSEYPPGTPPSGSHFPVRNRLMSGLSNGVVVVEGDMRSGALITARHALYQGRDLFAVPGRIGEESAAGPNDLIKHGAHAVTSAADILAHYEFLYSHTLNVKKAEETKSFSASGRQAEELAKRMNVSSRGGQKYYGEGLYGGKKNAVGADKQKTAKAADKSSAKEKKISPKAMLKRFSENAVEEPKKIIEAQHMELDMLGETELKIYAALIPDVPVLADDIQLENLSVADILAGLTMLELCGAVECGAGGYFMRRSADDLRTEGTDNGERE